jgi:hypothetical protein
MAQSQQPERDGQADFVRRIVTDPRNVPDVMRLYGYPGASSEENHDRLYLSPDLSTYIEVPREATLHRMAVPAEQDPNGAVVLWVRRDAALIQKAAPAAQALANYFAGTIAGAAATPAVGPALAGISYAGLCTAHSVCCPVSPGLACHPSNPLGPICIPSILPGQCRVFEAAAAPGVAAALAIPPIPTRVGLGCVPSALCTRGPCLTFVAIVCNQELSIPACGGSLACGAGYGQVGIAAAAAAAPQAAMMAPQAAGPWTFPCNTLGCNYSVPCGTNVCVQSIPCGSFGCSIACGGRITGPACPV